MVQINFALREVNCKIVYYGPGLSGKTTNLEVVHAKAPSSNCGELTSIATEGDRTLFFDFMPLNLGTVSGMKTKFQLYTVPGQVFYNSTRKLVLQGVDGVIFVADSRKGKMEENVESLENLRENLADYQLDLSEIPLVLQYNKRDLEDVYTIEELQKKLNPRGAPFIEASAVDGKGVFPTLKKLAGMVLENLNRQQSPKAKQKELQSKETVAAGAGRRAAASGASSAVAKGPGAKRAVRAEPERKQVSSRPQAVKQRTRAAVKGVKRHPSSKPGVYSKPGTRRRPQHPHPKYYRRRAAPVSKAGNANVHKKRKKNTKRILSAASILALAGAVAALFWFGVFG